MSYFNLGTYIRPITTTSPDAQLWFDRGLNWSYAFNHEEAYTCYQNVVRADPNCAMGYWGMAYALGPYYNITWLEVPKSALPDLLEATHSYAQMALEKMDGATAVEQALITALTQRFPQTEAELDEALFRKWDDAYADAMRQVYAQFPDDSDVCALTVEALICRTPWQLWDLPNGRPAPNADTSEAIHIVEKAINQLETSGAPPHPGLLHFYIHIMEMSPTPEKALPACDTLLDLVPDAGHLVHMPSHVYILCGDYAKSLDANRQATAVDQKYIAHNNALNVYTIYRLHNLHFQIYSALFLGQYETALRAANELSDAIPADAFDRPEDYLLIYLEAYSGMKAHVLIRFGKWQEILAHPMPTDPDLFCVTTAMWHYAKGIAYAVLGHIKEAEEQQAALTTAVQNIPERRIIFNNSCQDILAIAETMLAGELEYRRQNFDDAFTYLRTSVTLYDALSYTEPWPWMQPPRHALGALLLEQGHVDEATAVYRADLGLDDTLVRPSQHPNNIWSLHGYAECLRKQGKHKEAHTIEAKLNQAQTLTTFDVTASCLCRVEG